jgi:hypothetical protein
VEQVVATKYVTRATLWRVEKGDPHVKYQRGLIENLARLYGVDDQIRDDMVALAEETTGKGWLHAFGDAIPETFELYVDLEAIASQLSWYESELVPGLLQTKDYATEVIGAPEDREPDETLRKVQVRLARQTVFTRSEPPPPTVDFILNEAVLRRPVGSPAVMAEQLRHINDMGTLQNVAIRVVPFTVGLHHGVMSGPFVILHFSPTNGDVEPTTVYLDGLCGDQYLDRKHEVRQYKTTFKNLEANALDEEASRELIEQAARGFDQQ